MRRNFDSFLQNDAPIRIPVTADGKGFRLLIPKQKQPEQFIYPGCFCSYPLKNYFFFAGAFLTGFKRSARRESVKTLTGVI
jgi:hypothetical protein